MPSSSSAIAKPYTHPFTPPIPLLDPHGEAVSSTRHWKPFTSSEHYITQLHAQNLSYSNETGLFGTSKFPAESIHLRRVDDGAHLPLRPGQEGKMTIEVDTTHAPGADDWKRLEVRWFGCLTTWGETTSNGVTTVNIDHKPLFAFAAPLWNDGKDTSVGGRNIQYEDHIVGKKSTVDYTYLRAVPQEQPAPSYISAMSEKQPYRDEPPMIDEKYGVSNGRAGASGSTQGLQVYDVTFRLPDAEGSFLPANYRGDGPHNLSGKVAQVFYCIQVIAKRGVVARDRRVCAPIWVAPHDPLSAVQGYSEKHAAFFGTPAEDTAVAAASSSRQLDSRGIPIGWHRISLLEEHIKSWWFKKVAFIRTELYTPDPPTAGIASGRWTPFVFFISAIYLDGKDGSGASDGPSVEYRPQLILRRREVRTHYGTSREERKLVVQYDTDGPAATAADADAVTSAFYWETDDEAQGSNAKRARMAGRFRIDVPPPFQCKYPKLDVEYDLRIVWTLRSGNKFEKSLIKGLQVRAAAS